MAPKKKPPPPPLDDLPTVPRDIMAGRLTPWERNQLLMAAEHAHDAPARGRPRRYPVREIRWIVHDTTGDLLTHYYKPRGVWPDTKPAADGLREGLGHGVQGGGRGRPDAP